MSVNMAAMGTGATSGMPAEAPATEMMVLGSPRVQTRLVWVVLWGFTGLVLLLVGLRTFAQAEFSWLFGTTPTTPVSQNFEDLLAPFVAVAIAIERMLEAAFDWYEQRTSDVKRLLTTGGETVSWIQKQYRTAATSLAAASQQSNDPINQGLSDAEEVFKKAQERLENWLNGNDYRARKRAIAIWVGLLAGVVVATLGGLQMLAAIGVNAPTFVDILVTGLIIGTGPGPMHSIIGILQGGRDALANLANLKQKEAIHEAVKAVQTAAGEAGTKTT
jgi:hypothetical protein